MSATPPSWPCAAVQNKSPRPNAARISYSFTARGRPCKLNSPV